MIKEITYSVSLGEIGFIYVCTDNLEIVENDGGFSTRCRNTRECYGCLGKTWVNVDPRLLHRLQHFSVSQLVQKKLADKVRQIAKDSQRTYYALLNEFAGDETHDTYFSEDVSELQEAQ